MLTKRIIACLDVKDGRVVKGIQFVDLIDAGDPAALAVAHAEAGADEIVLLEIYLCPSPSAAAFARSTTLPRSSTPARTRSASIPPPSRGPS